MATILLLVSISSLAVIVVGYQKGTAIETASIERHLNTLRSAKAARIEDYFRHLRHTLAIMAENDMVYQSIRDYGNALDLLDKALLDTPPDRDSLDALYDDFGRSLATNLNTDIDESDYLPERASAIFLQKQYIVDNDAPRNQRRLLTDDGSGTEYNEMHKAYHPYYREVLQTLGLYDIMLVDYRTGDVVYTVEKEIDFGASFDDGAYAKSALGILLRELQDNLDLSEPRITDYSFYRPSRGAPTAFIGVNVSRGRDVIGALIFQIPVEQINHIMTSGGQWEQVGLGHSGETYLIGEDFLMRSISRFYLQDSSYTAQRGPPIGCLL